MKWLFLVLLISSKSYGNQDRYEEATKRALEAAYVQFGLQIAVEEFIERKTTKAARDAFGKWSAVARMLTEKKVQVGWTF